MSGRILNFLEFSDKYSAGNNEPGSLDDITNAASNFEEGFDKETYDQPEIKPNRPVAGEYESTPALPGESNEPAMSNDINLPEPTENDFNTEDHEEESEEPAEEETEQPEETEEEETEESEEPKEETEEDDDDEEGNPEAGANPKKVEESKKVRSFGEFISENYGDYPHMEHDHHHEHDPFQEEEEEDDDHCPTCGEAYLRNEYGVSCGCNM